MFGNIFNSYGVAVDASQLRPMTESELDKIYFEDAHLTAPAKPTHESILAMRNYRIEPPVRPLDEINADFAAFKVRLNAAVASRPQPSSQTHAPDKTTYPY